LSAKKVQKDEIFALSAAKKTFNENWSYYIVPWILTDSPTILDGSGAAMSGRDFG